MLEKKSAITSDKKLLIFSSSPAIPYHHNYNILHILHIAAILQLANIFPFFISFTEIIKLLLLVRSRHPTRNFYKVFIHIFTVAECVGLLFPPFWVFVFKIGNVHNANNKSKWNYFIKNGIVEFFFAWKSIRGNSFNQMCHIGSTQNLHDFDICSKVTFNNAI